MALIYRPRGKAREYAELACNHYRGCTHQCEYCYAPSATFTSREAFAHARSRDISSLSREAAKLPPGSDVLLCFTTDPYQPLDNELNLTRKVIQTLGEHGVKVTVLTKGGTRACKDFDLLAKYRGTFAASLTCDDDAESRRWEPNATLPQDRIEALRVAKRMGIQTWVSFEPVLDPDAVMRLIDETHRSVDLYKVGKLNYHPHAKEIDWPAFRARVVEKLERIGKPYLLKKDLVNAK